MVINSGGTLCQKRVSKDDVFRPKLGFLETIIPKYPEFENWEEYMDILNMHPLLDSAIMSPANWRQLATVIYDQYMKYRGFVVVHGTDTLSYSAAAITFMLNYVNKPIIFTGAQQSIQVPNNDGIRNFYGAVTVAKRDVPEVCVYFHDKLMRGTRIRKKDANDYNAFESTNSTLIGSFNGAIELDEDLIHSIRKQRKLQVEVRKKKLNITNNTPFNPLRMNDVESKICLVHLYPGFDLSVLASDITKRVRGIIFQVFGNGNGPTKTLKILADEAKKNYCVVVFVTECYGGSAEYSYATSLTGVGMKSCKDMTPESAFTKLAVLLAKYPDLSVKRTVCIRNDFRSIDKTLFLVTLGDADTVYITKGRLQTMIDCKFADTCEWVNALVQPLKHELWMQFDKQVNLEPVWDAPFLDLVSNMQTLLSNHDAMGSDTLQDDIHAVLKSFWHAICKMEFTVTLYSFVNYQMTLSWRGEVTNQFSIHSKSAKVRAKKQ